jgi:hypothetical protein
MNSLPAFLVMRSAWNGDASRMVKSAVFRNILSDDAIIRRSAAHAYAWVFAIEGGGWVDGMSEIRGKLATSAESVSTVIGLLSIVREIFGLDCFSAVLDDVQLYPEYHRMFVHVVGLLGSIESLDGAVRLEAAVCVCARITKLCRMFLPNIQNNVMAVLSALPAAFWWWATSICSLNSYEQLMDGYERDMRIAAAPIALRCSYATEVRDNPCADLGSGIPR